MENEKKSVHQGEEFEGVARLMSEYNQYVVPAQKAHKQTEHTHGAEIQVDCDDVMRHSKLSESSEYFQYKPSRDHSREQQYKEEENT